MSHEEDVIVRCSNTDSKNLAEVQPKDWTVRMMGKGGAESDNGEGRVEIFKEGRYWSICNTGWTDESAQVACK